MDTLSGKPVLNTLLFVKDVYANRNGGYDLQGVYDYLIVPKFPSEVVSMKLLLHWVGVRNPFVERLRLISPNQQSIFDVGATVDNNELGADVGYSTHSINVFFWIRQAGRHLLEAYMNEELILQRPFHIFEADSHRQLQQTDGDVKEDIEANLDGLVICRDGDFGRHGYFLSDILSDEGVNQGGSFTIFLSWNNVYRDFEYFVDYCDPNMVVIGTTTSAIQARGNTYTYQTLQMSHLSSALPVGMNWINVRWQNKKVIQPILVKA